MAKRTRAPGAPSATNGATVGYEAKLWQMAYALRGSMDAAEYKHVVLGLILLKYISDAFEELHARLVAEKKKCAELVEAVRNNVTIDWTLRGQLRVLVKRILREHGYPPDKQEKATQILLEQAEVLSAGWAVA